MALKCAFFATLAAGKRCIFVWACVGGKMCDKNRSPSTFAVFLATLAYAESDAAAATTANVAVDAE